MNKCNNLILKLFLLLILPMPLAAEQSVPTFSHGRHSIRVGWGESFLSASNYDFTPLYGKTFAPVYPSDIQPALEHVVGMPALEADQYLRDFRFVELGQMGASGHVFLGYKYCLTPLISLGVDVDYLYMRLPTQWYNGYNTPLYDSKYDQLHHLTLLPNIRFTYFRQRVLGLYSALGVGCSFYDFSASHNVGLALNLTLLGVNVGNEHWFAEVELGSFQSWALSCPVANGLYGSRLFSVAIGYCF